MQNAAVYAGNASGPALLLPAQFRNPFDQTTGDGAAWKDQPAFSPNRGIGSAVEDIVAYADSADER